MEPKKDKFISRWSSEKTGAPTIEIRSAKV
jgi:hypothetical protein